MSVIVFCASAVSIYIFLLKLKGLLPNSSRSLLTIDAKREAIMGRHMHGDCHRGVVRRRRAPHIFPPLQKKMPCLFVRLRLRIRDYGYLAFQKGCRGQREEHSHSAPQQSAAANTMDPY